MYFRDLSETSRLDVAPIFLIVRTTRIASQTVLNRVWNRFPTGHPFRSRTESS
jgi:hypothetical protein